MKYKRRHDGEWTNLSPKEMCCDCGLVHDYKYRVKKRTKTKVYIEVAVTRNKRSTALARRYLPAELKKALKGRWK